MFDPGALGTLHIGLGAIEADARASGLDGARAPVVVRSRRRRSRRNRLGTRLAVARVTLARGLRWAAAKAEPAAPGEAGGTAPVGG